MENLSGINSVEIGLAITVLITLLLVMRIYVNKDFKLGTKSTLAHEQYLEEQVKDLKTQVAALQGTIAMLSSRISALEKENSRLQRMVALTQRKTFNVANDSGDLIGALEKLSAGEITQLAYNNFRAVYNDFGADQSLQSKRLALVEYANNHNETDTLRSAILEMNPAALT